MMNLLLISTLAITSFAYAGPAEIFPESSHLHRRQLNTMLELDQTALFSQNFITPKNPVIPFRQWNSNNGYCGEVSFLQAGLNQGQWMSQYNARLICGTGLSQSGKEGFCSAHGDSNYNSQFLIENPNPGDSPFASAGLCLQNARLSYQLYDYAHAPTGMAGYRNYLSWIKAQVMAGNQVTIGVLNFGGSDSQYDHEVSVTRIGTNHDVRDPSYYEDDVLYFDEHGSGGSPYTQGFTFQSLAKSRSDANVMGAHKYSILIPGAFPTYSATGGDGIHDNPHPIVASNYAFSVSGPADLANDTLPVSLTLVGSSTNGSPNTPDSVDGYNFESPGLNDSCTNSPPSSWMTIKLRATVQALTPGTAYNLYEYDFNGITGIGAKAALAIPESNFNANAKMATKVTAFVADGATYTKTIQTTSDKIVAFRCVKANAP